jgi:hypothetical protein
MMLLLALCAGAAVESSGPLCGGTVAALSVCDAKDRLPPGPPRRVRSKCEVENGETAEALWPCGALGGHF